MLKVDLLLIDCQNDFCDPKGALFVPGADKDMERLAKMIHRIKPKINDIHATLDSHHFLDIAHPIFWVNSEGKNPTPFTIITSADIKDGTWRPANPNKEFQERGIRYVEQLETNQKYPLCIWPPHCLIGSWGYAVNQGVFEAMVEWEKEFAMVDYVTKGSNIWTEHYSAVQADVPDPQDPTTMLNNKLIDTLKETDIIALGGQALSHCLANTVRDIADNFGDENIKKLVLLRDATSSVTTFENLGESFIKEMVGRGMQVSSTTEFLV